MSPRARALPRGGQRLSGRVTPVRRTSAAFHGTLSNWHPQRVTAWQAERERLISGLRAEDLVANDGHAAGLVGSIAVNTIGTGLNPQSRPNAKRLGFSDDQAAEFAESAEWAWKRWAPKACSDGVTSFGLLQYLNMRSVLVYGELINLPLMLDDKSRPFSLALQEVHPSRLRTPGGRSNDPNIVDGIEIGPGGVALGYWLAKPSAAPLAVNSELLESNFEYRPAFIGHRPGLIHRFFKQSPEQRRGESILAPAMKFFVDLSSYLDFELVANIITASFPIFIETEDPHGALQAMADPDQTPDGTRYTTYAPAQILYGGPNQKPHLLSPNRPGGSFGIFVERVLRAAGAATGMPYEIVAKDFSKTNYSSARAALLEAWRVFTLYRSFLREQFCQLCWNLLLEEAWLRDELTLPPKAPDFYDAQAEYCQADWIAPPRGHVDPVKEMNADIAGIEAGILTLSDVIAERGRDWESTLAQRAREKAELQKYGLSDDTAGARKTLDSTPADAPEESGGQGENDAEAA